LRLRNLTVLTLCIVVTTAVSLAAFDSVGGERSDNGWATPLAFLGFAGGIASLLAFAATLIAAIKSGRRRRR